MLLLKDLELLAVEYDELGKSVVLTFLDSERGQVRDVKWNKRSYRDGKYVDDPEKAKEVEEWSQEYFSTDFEHLTDCLGVKKDVYCYPRFNSLWEVETISKFAKEDKGEIFQTEIEKILIDDYFIKIRYKWNDNTYESKQTFGKFIPEMGTYLNNPNKELQEREKFKEKYGVPVEEADKLIGKTIMVEVKQAFQAYYGEIKKPPKNW